MKASRGFIGCLQQLMEDNIPDQVLEGLVVEYGEDAHILTATVNSVRELRMLL